MSARLAPDELVRRLEELPRDAWETPEPPPLVLPERARRRRGFALPRIELRPMVAAGAAAALVALGVGAGALVERGGDGPDTRSVALEPLPPIDPGAAGTSPNATGAVAISGRTAEVDVASLRPNRDGDFYELWMLTPPGKLVSLGSFRVTDSGTARVRVPLPADPSGYEFFDISVEPPDGNPAHSSKSVLRGRTT